MEEYYRGGQENHPRRNVIDCCFEYTYFGGQRNAVDVTEMRRWVMNGDNARKWIAI